MSWEERSIDSITEIVTKGTTPTTYGYNFIKEGVNYIRAEAISKGGRIKEDTFLKISFDCHEKLKRSQLKSDDILFSIAGMALGKTGIVKENYLPANTNQAVAIIRPIKELINPRFLQFQFINPNFYELVNKFSAQAAQPNINLTQLKSLSILTPPLQTQKRIADILSAYDDLIENNLKRIKLLEQTAQNIYKEWFVNLRFPGHENAVINEETGLPEGWEEKALGEFTEIKKGKNITKSTIVEGNVPVVAGGLKPAYYHNVPNTINPVITVSASGANAGYVNIYLEDIWASDCSYIDTNLSDSIFFIHNLLSHQQDLIFGMQRGAAQPHVYPKDLKRTEFLIPEKGLIIKFEEQVSPQYKMKRVLLGQNQKLKAARDILLPRLMNRTIEV